MDKITIERETPAGMIYPPKPPPRHCGYIPDGSGVKWNAYDTMQMEAYARAAYADGFAAAQPVEPQEPVAWLKTMYSGTRPMLEVDHMTPPNLKSFPVYAAPPAPPAPAAVPLTDDQLRTDLISCRGTVKSELNHYERLTMVHGKTVVAENYEREAQRLSDLLDRIDALIAASGDKP